MEKAKKELAKGELPVAAIADSLGFPSAQHFATIFHRIVGMTPSEWRVRDTLSVWTKANGGKFPSDVIVGLRLGDEIFNATGWLNCPAASFPLWDYSASAVAAFRAASPKGVEPPRTWGAPEVYGADACAQSLYLFHKACTDPFGVGYAPSAQARSPWDGLTRTTVQPGSSGWMPSKGCACRESRNETCLCQLHHCFVLFL